MGVFIGILSVWNLIVMLIYGMDKLKAKKGSRRIRESALLFCAFLLGGFGAMFGMIFFNHKTSKIKFRLLIPLSVVVFIAFVVQYIYCGMNAYHTPDYQMTDISDILSEDNLSDDIYEKIFLNTGVAPKVVREIIDKKDTGILITLNKLYFKSPSYKKSYIAFPVTANELNTGMLTPIIPLKKGDVLVTFNTHTLSYRHGHSAIVTDDEGQQILEHLSVGNKSRITLSKRWGIYPGFVVLRYKDEDVASKAAEYAKKHLSGIDYSIFADYIHRNKTEDEYIDSSHCAHIVWQAYKGAGCDIDSDKGWIVTPYDISMCEDFYVVQIFGIDPKNYIDRIYRA